MKINKQLYSRVFTEPFDVQELENDVTVELHSLNENEGLYAQYASQGKFALWTSQDGKHYRLILEDGYYQETKELYGKRVNQTWINFWESIERDRGKIMKTIFLPLVIFVVIAFVLITFFSKQLGNPGQILCLAATFIVFVIGNIFVNKKVNNIVNTHNSQSVEKIKNIVGHKHFEELLEAQRTYYEKFFHYDEPVEEEALEEEPAEVQEETLENNEEEEKE